jgi:chromosome segregation ATPase
MARRKEASRITIANLEREVRNLTLRCTELVLSRDEAIRRHIEIRTVAAGYSSKIERLEGEIKRLRESVDCANNEVQYLNGYVARTKEEDNHRMAMNRDKST